MTSVYIEARWYTRTNGRHIAVGVVHRVEAPDRPTTAEGVANYFAGLPPSRKASAHSCHDSDSSVTCVLDQHVAYAAPGANHDGKHYELSGYSRDDDWDSPTMVATLERCAIEAADDALRYGWPIRWITAADLLAGGDRRRGFTSHAEVSKAYPHLGNHWDPGPHFDPDQFLQLVARHVGAGAPSQFDAYTFRPGDDLMPNLAASTVVGTISARLCGFPDAPEEAIYEQTADGGVKALFGAPFFGSYPGLDKKARKTGPEGRFFIGIGPNEDGSPGYTSWANDSIRGYAFGPGKNGR